MTLIVAAKLKDGIILAADSLGTDTRTGDRIYGFDKIRSIEDKFLIGLAGNQVSESYLDDIQSKAEYLVGKNSTILLDELANLLGDDLTIVTKRWLDRYPDFHMFLILASAEDFVILTFKPPKPFVIDHSIYGMTAIGLNRSVNEDIETSKNKGKRFSKEVAQKKIVSYMRTTQKETNGVGGQVKALYIDSGGVEVLPYLFSLGR